MGSVNSNPRKEKGGKQTVSIVILVLVILVLTGVIIYLLMSLKPNEKKRRNQVITSDNVEEIFEQMEEDEYIAPGYYTVTMNYDWYFATGDAVSANAYVENAVDNTNAVYFDLFLASDDENAIYKSPVIPLGGRLENIALDAELDAGTYDVSSGR